MIFFSHKKRSRYYRILDDQKSCNHTGVPVQTALLYYLPLKLGCLMAGMPRHGISGNWSHYFVRSALSRARAPPRPPPENGRLRGKSSIVFYDRARKPMEQVLTNLRRVNSNHGGQKMEKCSPIMIFLPLKLAGLGD